MMICDEHRLNDSRRNDEPCIYCQRNALIELLREADNLYTNYGLIAGGVKGYPKYDGTVDVGEWINKVRKIARVVEKSFRGCDMGCDLSHHQDCSWWKMGQSEKPRCENLFDGQRCGLMDGHPGLHYGTR